MEVFFKSASFAFPIFVYFFQIALTFVIALGISAIPYPFLKKRMHNAHVFSLILSVLIVFGSVYHLTFNPFFICDEAKEQILTEKTRQEIIDYSSGIYSSKLPIFPIYIKINSVSTKIVRFETRYLYFGSTTTEYTIDENFDTKFVIY